MIKFISEVIGEVCVKCEKDLCICGNGVRIATTQPRRSRGGCLSMAPCRRNWLGKLLVDCADRRKPNKR